MKGKKSASKHQLEPLAVILSHCATIVKVLQHMLLVTGLGLMKDKMVECKTDDMQVYCLLKMGPSKNVTCMYWLCKLFWICMLYNITLSPSYISTEENYTADLSPGWLTLCSDEKV